MLFWGCFEGCFECSLEVVLKNVLRLWDCFEKLFECCFECCFDSSNNLFWGCQNVFKATLEYNLFSNNFKTTLLTVKTVLKQTFKHPCFEGMFLNDLFSNYLKTSKQPSIHHSMSKHPSNNLKTFETHKTTSKPHSKQHSKQPSKQHSIWGCQNILQTTFSNNFQNNPWSNTCLKGQNIFKQPQSNLIENNPLSNTQNNLWGC